MPGQNYRGFTERVALVTGGARGVGRAVALQLALQGAYVIVNYAGADEEGARVVNELREMGTLGHAVEGGVSRAVDVERVFAEVEAIYGRLDILVNAASINSDATLDALTETAWDEMLNSSLKSAFLCSRAATRLMQRRPFPAIVNVASEAGLTGTTGDASHVAAHAGIIGLTKALARELAPRIRVNCVAAANIRSGDAIQSHEDDAAFADVRTVAAHASHAVAPDEVARACVYLLSPDAASITGQTLVVNAAR